MNPDKIKVIEHFGSQVRHLDLVYFRDAPAVQLSEKNRQVGYANTGHGGTCYTLTSLQDFKEEIEKQLVQPVKEHEIIVYARLLSGNMTLLKVSFKYAMIYHLSQESSTGETDDIRFETRGVKCVDLVLDVAEDVFSTDDFIMDRYTETLIRL